MEGQQLKQKSTQTPFYLPVDIRRYCKNQDIESTIVLHLRRKMKEKVMKSYYEDNWKILILRILLGNLSRWKLQKTARQKRGLNSIYC